MQKQQQFAINSERFITSALSELYQANSSPIFGYQHLTILSLEQSTERIIPLVPGLVDYVAQAKNQCNQNSSMVTIDESAAIYLYTMSIPFYSCLNENLRAKNRHALKPWFAFLKLFLTALEKLPSCRMSVWRGVWGNMDSTFAKDDVCTWWSVNSCSTDPNVVEAFLGDRGTVFTIDAEHGKDISAFSSKQDEQEVVLMPGTRLRVKSLPFHFDNRLLIVDLKEEPSVMQNSRLEYQKPSTPTTPTTPTTSPLSRQQQTVICGGPACPTCRRCCDWRWNGQRWNRVGRGCRLSDVSDRVSAANVISSRLFGRPEPPRVHVPRTVCHCESRM